MSAIRAEAEGDAEGIFQVHRETFGQEDEARLVEALRRGGYCRVSLVAEIKGDTAGPIDDALGRQASSGTLDTIVGHVLFSEISIRADNGDVMPALSLAPVAVLPALQRRGIGSALVREGLSKCREAGHRIAIVVGDARFYERFGFSTAAAQPLSSPYSGEHWLAIELLPGGLSGVSGHVEYSPPFSDL